MATFLDVALLKDISIIFPFILVWVVVFSVLEWRKIFGESKGIHSIIALVIAFLTLLSPAATQVITLVSPWFVIVLFFVLFLLMLYKMFGVTDETIAGVFTDREHRSVSYWVLIVTILIFVGALGQVFFSGPIGGSALESQNEGDVGGIGQEAFFSTLFHPKILGFIFIMVIATFTVKTLAGELIFPK